MCLGVRSSSTPRQAGSTARPDVATGRIGLRRGFVARQLGLVERHLFQESLGDARPGLQKFTIAFDGRPRRKIDAQRHRPVQDRVEIRVSDGETIEQILAAGEVAVEILQPRFIFLQGVLSRSLRRLLIEQRNEKPLVQFRADEAQPLLQVCALPMSSFGASCACG